MRIVITGGSGQLGRVLKRGLSAQGHEVQIVGRSVSDPRLRWDGRTLGPWCDVLEGADAVINLAGRSVDCRYHWANLTEMMQSRLDSTRVLGEAIARAARPPDVWLQASTASIYPDHRGPPLDERFVVGPYGEGVPAYWSYSVSIARSWEAMLFAAPTPSTRRVAMRLGFTMSPDADGIFDVLMGLLRVGLGGRFRDGEQYVSWISDLDLVRAVEHLLNSDLEGPVNVTAPEPLQNHAFMRSLRQAAGIPFGLPILPGMDRVGAWLLSTDAELMHKSRRVVPKRLEESGFWFVHPAWESAAADLVGRWRAGIHTGASPSDPLHAEG